LPTRTSMAVVPVAVHDSVVIPDPDLSHTFIGFGLAVSLPVAAVFGFAGATGTGAEAFAGALFCESLGALVQPQPPTMGTTIIKLATIRSGVFMR